MARRKLLEETPIPSITEEAVVFDTAEIPWWAWVRRFHLPEVGRWAAGLRGGGLRATRLLAPAACCSARVQLCSACSSAVAIARLRCPVLARWWQAASGAMMEACRNSAARLPARPVAG